MRSRIACRFVVLRLLAVLLVALAWRWQIAKLRARRTALEAEFRERQALLELLKTLSFRTGNFTLASGKQAGYYLDCRMTTLDGPRGGSSETLV